MALHLELITVGVFLLVMALPWVSKPSRNPRFGDRSPDGAPINTLIGAIVGVTATVYGVIGLLS